MDPDERVTGKGGAKDDAGAWADSTDRVPPADADAGDADDRVRAERDGGERADPWARLGEEARRLADSLSGGDKGDEAPAARLAEEARRLAETLVEQADAVREQVVRRHPEVAAHLAAAGAELASAYRAFVGDRERRWAAKPAETERIRLDDE
ncbi:DUF5304 family protein [Embleya sp. NPDC020886]|uniref:DUF5304 family protein n=1 Tax=Embleya sp. NPDC020886 TaxID=3363980 RepID=UPI0037B6F490